MAFKLISATGVLVLLSVLLVLSIFQRVYRASTAPLRHLPGPLLARFSRWWLFGAIGSRKFQNININLHKKYGPIVRIGPNEYSIDDWEAAQVIYRPRDQLIKSSRYSAWGLPDAEPNLLTQLDVQAHADRRRQINSIYSTSALLNIEYHVDDVLKAFLGKLDGFVKAGVTVDMSEWLQLYTFDTIGALTFGKPFGFLDQGTDIADIMSTIHTYSRYGAIMGVFAEWHPTIFGLMQLVAPKGNVGLAYVHHFAATAMAEHSAAPLDSSDILNKNSIAEAEESGILKKDYLTTLYARHRMDPKAFDEGSIYYHILSNVIAGAETTGIALSAVFYYLDRHRSVLAKLRAELDAFMAKREAKGFVTMKESLELPYLQAVLKEALRMFPSAGLPLPRVVPKGGLTLAGQLFPEGTIVGINAWAAHANRDVYGLDADEFRPERWLGDQASRNRMEQYFFTFGRGPRTCSGKAITMMEMSKLVPELVLRYEIGLADARHDWTVCNDWFVRQYDFLCTVRARK